MKFTSKNRCTWFDNSSDKQGDRTDIALTQHQLTPAQLTDDERQRFAAQ